MKGLLGKTALVTGASRRQGIGAAICRKLAAEGVNLFFTYWTPYDQSMPWGISSEEPEHLEQTILQLGVQCAKQECDLSQPENIKSLWRQVTDTIGTPDILVNNATYSTNGTYADITASELDRHYAVNIRATLLLSAHFGRDCPDQRGGRIISLTSGQFQGPMPNEIAYVATKGAIDAMTISLAAEMAPKQITVNAVNPGPNDTGWMNPELKEELLPRFPMGRVGTPDDTANLVAFLASEDAAWITGQIIHSEGGFLR